MKKTLLKLSFAFFVLLSLSSCKKNSNSKTELLTQKAWIISNLEIGSGGNWTIDDDFASWEDCRKDDQFIFKINKTIEVNQGASKCEETESSTGSGGYWDLIDDETKLNVLGDTGTINQLDENTLTVTFESTSPSSRITFRH